MFLLLIPAGIAAWFMYRRRVLQGILFSPMQRLPAQARTWRVHAAWAFSFLFLAGLVLAIAALARPRTVLSQSHRRADVIAIYMVLDVSGSMEALDMSDFAGNSIVRARTRLDAVKETFSDFVAKRPDDLVGLITFGGYAATRSPLTPDHEALRHMLKGVEVPRPSQDQSGQVVNQEELLTAIGDGLATACARMEKSEPKSRIVVLLSDGESNTGVVKPEEAIRVAKKMGIRVYTIGVGSTGVAPFRGRDAFGREAVVPVQVSLDEDLLRKIAADTGAQYFNVRNPKGLEKAMADISKLEKTTVERDIYNQYQEWFVWCLWPALGLLSLATAGGMLTARRLL
jgi:Ca-activated chloride channel family protein